MGRLGQFAGLLLLAGGGGLAAWGAPYYMLDWGSTFVMAGIALASAGLSCILLGTVLIKLAALRTDIAGLRAASAVAMLVQESADDDPAVLAERPASAQSAANPPAIEPARAAGGLTAGGIAGVAVAGAAAGGLAMAAKSILTSVSADEPDARTSADNGAADMHPATGEADSDPHPKPSELTADDRASLDDLLAKLSLPISADEQGTDGISAQDMPADMADPHIAGSTWLDADDLYARIDDAARSLQAKAAAPDDSQESTTAEPTMEQRIDDEFADLRAELSAEAGTMRADSNGEFSAASSVLYPKPLDEAKQRLEAEEDADKSELTRQHDGEQENIHDVTSGIGKAGAADPEPAVVEDVSLEGARPVDDAPSLAEPPAAGEPAPAEQLPSSSTEGVVAAYNVGDTSYAMFVDGRIRVSTPEGQFMLESMDQLKSFMAARRAGSDAERSTSN